MPVARTSTNVVWPCTFNVDIWVDAPYNVEVDVQIKLLLTAKYEKFVVDVNNELDDKLFKLIFICDVFEFIVVIDELILFIFKAEYVDKLLILVVVVI